MYSHCKPTVAPPCIVKTTCLKKDQKNDIRIFNL